MAEMNEQQAIEFLEKLKEANPALAKFIDTTKKLNNTFNRAAKDFHELGRNIDGYTRSMKMFHDDGVGKFVKGLKNGFSTVDDFSQALRELDDVIDQTTNTSEKHDLEMKREIMARRASMIALQSATADFVKNFSKVAITGIANTAGSFVKGLQNNASATELSGTLLTGAVDLAAGAATTAGQGISRMGDTAMSLAKPGSKLQLLGAAASLAGSALSGFAENASKLAKFGIEVLNKEVEKTIASFNNMSKSGALFGDGMTGMRKTANQAGLTVEQLSKVVTENAGVFAEAGLGVGEATKKLGNITAVFDQGNRRLRKEMLNLGYSFEEQAALAAETMADMRRGRSSLIGDDRAIAQQTAEYAANLRTIAAISGEDAKAKMQEQRRAATQVAFRLKLQELEQKQPGITQKLLASMATMDETSRRALMEQLTIGAVVDKAANVMMAGSQAYQEKVTGIAQLAESGAFTTEEAQRIQAAANDKMQGDLTNFREIGIAGMTGALSDLNSAISGQIANMDRVTTNAVTSSQTLVDQQRTTNDELTRNTRDAAIAAQNLKVALETELTGAIRQYSRVTKEVLEAVQNQLRGLGLETKPEEKGMLSKAWDWIKESKAISKTTGALGGAAFVGGAASSATGIGAIAGIPLATIGAVLSGVSMLTSAVGLAKGGVVSGPDEGFLTKLHGQEAVIPLDEGRSVPVKLDISGIGQTLAEMAGNMAAGMTAQPRLINQMNTAANFADQTNAATNRDNTGREQLSLLNEIRDILMSSKDIQQQYVYNTYN